MASTVAAQRCSMRSPLPCCHMPAAPRRQTRRCSKTIARAQPAVGSAMVKERWWEKNPQPNLLEAHSFEDIASVLQQNQSSLVLLDFYAPWCNACKSLYPKLNKLCVANPGIVIVKVNWQENKALAKTMGVKVLPFFMGFHGSMGKVAAFSSSITKIQRLYDCIELFGQPFCNIGDVDLSISLPEFQETPEDATRVVYSSDSSGEEEGAPNPAAEAAGLL